MYNGTMEADSVELWLSQLGRKVEVGEVDDQLVEAATVWARNWAGDFPFMLKMSTAAQAGVLTNGQAKGVLNCWRADVVRRQRRDTPASGLNLLGIPAGKYAVPDGETRLKVAISAPTTGRWAGWVFVKDAAVYGYGGRYGAQRPGGTYRGDIVEQLRAIAADPEAATAAYGRLTSTCGMCGRALENAASVKRGIGPDCAVKYFG